MSNLMQHKLNPTDEPWENYEHCLILQVLHMNQMITASKEGHQLLVQHFFAR